MGIEPSTNSHLTDSESKRPGLQPLPFNPSAADFSATPRRLIPVTPNKQFINVYFTRKTNPKGQCRNTRTDSNRCLNARGQRAWRAYRACRTRTVHAPQGSCECCHCTIAGLISTTLAQILLIIVVPKLHKPNILASGMHWEIRPVRARLRVLDASWYLVHTSLFVTERVRVIERM